MDFSRFRFKYFVKKVGILVCKNVFRNLYDVVSCPKKTMSQAGRLLPNISQTIMKQNDDDCSVPCRFSYLNLQHMPALPNDNQTRTFTFYMKSDNMLTKSKFIYDIWSFIAELGGWVGLFIGLSVPDLFDYVTLVVDKLFSFTISAF